MTDRFCKNGPPEHTFGIGLLRSSHYAALHDDIVVSSTSWEHHLSHLRDVLERLKNAGLTANVSKCVFAANRIKILGHIVDNGRICRDDETVKVIENWKPPKNKTQLRTSFGMVNFFSQYIRNYAEIAAPLTTLLARNK